MKQETLGTPEKARKPKTKSEEDSLLNRDPKQWLQMCKVMKYKSIPRFNVVFDFMTVGDLFYMLIKGVVYCKVPMFRQLIHLNQFELKMFKQEFHEDIISIESADMINNVKGQAN